MSKAEVFIIRAWLVPEKARLKSFSGGQDKIPQQLPPELLASSIFVCVVRRI